MFDEELERLRSDNLFRRVANREAPSSGSHILIDGKHLINFASNDYLGFSEHPSLKEGAINATNQYGTGTGASRLLGGGFGDLHEKLENELAIFKGTQKAILFGSGYLANVGSIPALADKGDLIFSDELNHASIIDGCRLSRAKTLIYKHRDVKDLNKLLEQNPTSGRKLIISDSVFSMDGDIAPICELSECAKENGAMLYLDDAHATGVLAYGKGALQYAGVASEPHIIQMGTLSKAFGSAGGFVAGTHTIIDWLINKSRSFIYSTAPAPSTVGASLKALEMITDGSAPIKQLEENIKEVHLILKSLGLKHQEAMTPILPIASQSIHEALQVSRALYEMGIFAPAIRPPTVKAPIIRISVTALHTKEDLSRLKDALELALGK